ncbi:DnaJ domain-containing protein [Dehalobacterium formicoaceticum]|uniref:DnaJ domain-containing protein n=1 Tax=Dehalobacterium formicoaceticum TaxID=51515 RepID=A0ABT1Y041_9FIRM|nr:DnaJ domain-containing protein [Dehalobacterium formicoaceticum]MCR6544235.1 DnaJ domain-containing protein [Dehalobacterium formicoaceticum]
MTGGTQKRKTKKKNAENLYKILGTRSNIGQDRIKEKYIEKLREFPPETHPEEFQEIRRAYETLKDVNKRKQYDMLRKYGDKLEKTMDDVMFLRSTGEYQKAMELVDYVLEIEPDNTAVRLEQAELFLDMENIEEFNRIFNKILETCDIAEKQYVLFIQFKMLYSEGYYDEALAALEKNKECITDLENYHKLRAMAFLDSRDLPEGWKELKNALPPIDNLTIEDLEILLLWLNTGIALEKWGEISKIQSYFRKLSKTINDEEDLAILKDHLLEEAESYVEANRYRAADVIMQLASQIFKKDLFIKERKEEIQSIARLDMELKQSSKDQELFPYVQIKIVGMFIERHSTPEDYEEFLGDYPHELMEEWELMKENIAHGILRIKKKYPSLYKEFNQELTILFNESTEGLNREQRRGLR